MYSQVQRHPNRRRHNIKEKTRFSHYTSGHESHKYMESLMGSGDGHTQALQDYGSLDLCQVG
ncbi:hypothetical protein BAE44_0017009 [Dichanthelium oligosanthes]|uniref:Uncharacterized protein n=1 Tax=Dichanthelium oligosanthes TaxID=888268 RepID=A0A1E5V9Z3_9POAL|nr:hypothetical protein BAE44_0017009 [Dichanthelium oligosanthes]